MLKKIRPCRIHSFDRFELPCAIPFLHLTLADRGLLPCVMLLIPDQCLDAIAFRKTRKHSSFMHPNALDEIVGHPDVKRSVATTCSDVDVESHACCPGSPAFAGTNGESLPFVSIKFSPRAPRRSCRRAVPP